MSDTQQLVRFRERINEIDDQLVALLAQRLDVCREVGEFKSERGISVLQPDRIEEVKARNSARGEAVGLRSEFMRQLYGLIIEEACALEEDILADAAKNA